MATNCRGFVLTGMDANLKHMRPYRLAVSLAASIIVLLTLPAWAADSSAKQKAAETAKPKLDRSGRSQVGEASIYADKFANEKMADGNRMDPDDDNAAHKTLPLGTKARVTNLETGQSTHVTIQDRGPYVKGRIIDLPPSKAEEIGLTLKDGVTKVEVVPIKVPPADDSTKLVDGEQDTIQ